MPKIIASSTLSITWERAIKGILIHSILTGDSTYRNAQGMVGNLPKFLIPDGYNIFIEGGALDQFGDNAFDPEGKYAEFKKQSQGSRRESHNPNQESDKRPYSLNFKNSITNDLAGIKVKAPFLKELREWFESNKEPYTLFGFDSENKVNTNDLKKSYRRLAILCHPDKCSTQFAPEATILFKMINTVREDIEEIILKKI